MSKYVPVVGLAMFGTLVLAAIQVAAQPPEARSQGALAASPGRVRVASAETPGVQWSTDLQRAAQLASQQNKPLILVFGASWCAFCQKLENETLSDPRLARVLNRHFVPVYIDVERQPQIAKQLGIKSLPATVLVGPDTRYWGRIQGFADPQDFYRQIAAIHTEAIRNNETTAAME